MMIFHKTLQTAVVNPISGHSKRVARFTVDKTNKFRYPVFRKKGKIIEMQTCKVFIEAEM